MLYRLGQYEKQKKNKKGLSKLCQLHTRAPRMILNRNFKTPTLENGTATQMDASSRLFCL